MKNIPFSKTQLESIFDYNQKSGMLFWKNGKRAGSNLYNGYRRVKLQGVEYKEHRLIWVLFFDKQPKQLIDHINGIKDDNRIENLREASVSQNTCNSKLSVRNNTKTKGVYYNHKRKKYIVNCSINGNSKYLGSYKTLEEAQNTIRNYREKIHGEYTNHG